MTDLDDLVDYFYSLPSMTALSPALREDMKAILARHMADGVLTVPKEYGMLLASGLASPAPEPLPTFGNTSS